MIAEFARRSCTVADFISTTVQLHAAAKSARTWLAERAVGAFFHPRGKCLWILTGSVLAHEVSRTLIDQEWRHVFAPRCARLTPPFGALKDRTTRDLVHRLDRRALSKLGAADHALEAAVVEHQSGGHEVREAIEIQGLAVVL